ncbi:MAG: hypothetical protein HY820_36495 [Acidobacteria bacterium]|nr:hypothetical protein [Acidobacteriota bacterium]
MRLRIRLSEGPRIKRTTGKNRHLADAASALLTPAAVLAAVLAIWRICAGLNIAGEFAIRDGPFSHWWTWLAVALLLQGSALMLARYGSGR